MPRPFLPNLTITFTVPWLTYFTIDPITGNPTQAAIPYVVQAWVKMQNRDGIKSIADINVGTNPNEIDLQGYAVEPKVLPTNLVRSRIEGQAVYTDPVTGSVINGKFTMTPQLEGNRARPARQVAKVIGSKIKGKFEITEHEVVSIGPVFWDNELLGWEKQVLTW